MNKECRTCNKSFNVKPSHFDIKFYCSKSCMAEDYKTRMKGDNNPNYQGKDKEYLFICPTCNKEFHSYSHKTAKYCSISCKAKSPESVARMRAQSKRAGMMGGRKRTPRPCAICGDDTGIRWRKYCKSCKSDLPCGGGMDANQPEIVEALEAAGCRVFDLHKRGRGVPDLLVVNKNGVFLLEIKNPETKGYGLTPFQKRWHNEWRGQVAIVNSVDAAISVIQGDKQ